MTTPRIPIPMDRIERFCAKWKITELALFGSVLRDDFGPQSDVDVLVTFAPGERIGLLTFARIERELGELLGRRVDLVLRRAVEANPADPRNRDIRASARALYAA
jgi:predicted nucleotidyltransferase